MRPPTLETLPPPPSGKTGWPWTESSPAPATAAPLPRITVVTPSYNQGEYIEETIRSVLLQNYPGLEYIVMDGGSTDGTVEIVRKYESWLTHWESVRDKGQTDAINKGFHRATGQVLTWLNSDDFLLNGALAKLVSDAGARGVLQAGAAVPAFAAGCGYLCDAAGGMVRVFSALDAAALARDIRFSYPMLQPAVFFNRALWEALGPFDAECRWTFDWELWIRAVARGAAVHCLPEFLAAAHHHEGQKTETGAEKRYIEMREMLRRNAGGEADFAGLVEAVDGLRPWFARLHGVTVRHYAEHLLAFVLQRRFRRFSRRQIRELMCNFGM